MNLIKIPIIWISDLKSELSTEQKYGILSEYGHANLKKIGQQIKKLISKIINVLAFILILIM